MIRLPPTVIVIGRSDLSSYDKRRQRPKDVQTTVVNEQYARIGLRASDSPAFTIDGLRDAWERDHLQPRGSAVPSSFISVDQRSPSPDDTTVLEQSELKELEEVDDVYLGMDEFSENAGQETERSVSPPKDDFYYGGFVESPALPTDNTSQRSSPFTPDDVSTPQLPEARRLRGRMPLPRSPLFLSQNASSSPERRPTTSLTPRVASRVANHYTPGIIFSQPARRPPRSLPHATFRHQTNSFSFDSSERASAAYEQERVLSASSAGDGPHVNTDRSLREELRGSSLQSSRTNSREFATAIEYHGDEIPIIIREPTEDEGGHGPDRDVLLNVQNDFAFSSPQLPLPPPFSAVSRSVSSADSLPSFSAAEYMPDNPPTSPIRSNSSTPVRSGVEGRQPTPNSGERELDRPNPGNGISPRSIIQRIISTYRARSPVTSQQSPPGSSPSPSPTPRRTEQRNQQAGLEAQTPSRFYRIYNDALSPDSQPQTPAHLPEARHQSRYHPSYTAPVTRAAARRRAEEVNNNARGADPQAGSPQRRTGPIHAYTPLHRGRRASPTGLTTRGFQGLYGGRENGDEERNWVEGVWFNHAETRLWGVRDARNDNGNLRETPEPEDWRVGRRN